MRKYHTFELALLLALASALLWGAWSLRRQDNLQEKMIRLHVIANSDSDADQTLKLHVRDAVLRRAEDILRQSADMTDARRRLTDALPAMGDAAASELAARGSADPVSVSLEETGQNWWCVVYPPLCTAAACELEETARSSGLTADDVSLRTGVGTGYILRFRSLELWERLRQWLGK